MTSNTKMTAKEIDEVVEARLNDVKALRCITKPLNGQVFIAPLPEPQKTRIVRPDQNTADVVAESARAIVVAVADGYWSQDASQLIPIDLEHGDGVALVRAEGLHDGTVPVMDPACPVPLLAIHYRMIVGKFNFAEYIRESIAAKERMDEDRRKAMLNGEG